MNAREQLSTVAEWLGWQDEALSFGLRNSMDALRLYDYAQARSNLPEMADEWTSGQRKAALGYDPLATVEASRGRDVAETGARTAHGALLEARALINSVAFVAKEGDTAPVLALLDKALKPLPQPPTQRSPEMTYQP